jgi:arsenite methyltransferase
MTAPRSTASITELVGAFQAGSTGDPDAVKSCCAAVYGVDLVALFLGESYHPGGAELTRHLAEALSLHAGERVLDVASGIGTTALLLAAERDVDVLGVDLGASQVARARDRAAAAGLGGRARFGVGDAERLPVEDGGFDAVVCECAFCTFPDKATAAAELARVLRPGGKVGITDVALDPTRLHEELQSLAGWVACLADARPVGQYVELLGGAGLETTYTESHDDALARMVEQIDARLVAFRMAKLPALEGIDFDAARERTALAAQAVRDGIAGYSLLIAQKP